MPTLYLCRILGVPDHDRCNALAVSGHDVLLVDWAVRTDYVWKLPTPALYRTVVVDAKSTGPIGRLMAVLQLARSCLAFRPRVALIYGYNYVAIFLVALLLGLTGTTLLSMNDSKFDDYRRRWLSDLGKVVMLAPYRGFLAATRRAAEYLFYLTGNRRIEIYHCAVDVSRFVAAAERLGSVTAFEDREFLVVGRFVAKKNHLRLVDLFERYAASCDQPRRLRFIGYGELEGAMRERIARSELLARLVTIEGYVAPADLPAAFARSLALLLPSTEEQFGIVVTEALAAGVPAVISTACGATDILYSQVAGYVVDESNDEGWIAAMRTLGQDRPQWEAMCRNARSAAMRADVSVFVNAVQALTSKANAPGTLTARPRS